MGCYQLTSKTKVPVSDIPKPILEDIILQDSGRMANIKVQDTIARKQMIFERKQQYPDDDILLIIESLKYIPDSKQCDSSYHRGLCDSDQRSILKNNSCSDLSVKSILKYGCTSSSALSGKKVQFYPFLKGRTKKKNNALVQKESQLTQA